PHTPCRTRRDPRASIAYGESGVDLAAAGSVLATKLRRRSAASASSGTPAPGTSPDTVTKSGSDPCDVPGTRVTHATMGRCEPIPRAPWPRRGGPAGSSPYFSSGYGSPTAPSIWAFVEVSRSGSPGDVATGVAPCASSSTWSPHG